MTIATNRLLELVEAELVELNNARIETHVRGLLISPHAVVRGWDYGAKDEAYPCWSVLEHKVSNTGISYCEQGFGPETPWGLVFLAGTEHMSMGMDCGWFQCFLDAYFESQAVTELPIWRVFQSPPGEFPGKPLTVEGSWGSTWVEVERLRALHPDNSYDCRQSVYHRKA